MEINRKIESFKNQEVTHIVHIADIHIRLLQRHKEYNLIFDKFYEELKKTPPNTLVTIVGDLVHSKTDVSPEMINVVSNMLINIADIRPTVVIRGNHDMSVSNLHRMDTLRPIMELIEHDDLYYIDDVEEYEIGKNVNLFHYPFWEDPSTYITPEKSDKLNVCMFHGPVYNSNTDTGFVITNRHYPVSAFDGFDLVLLGDIHRRQILQRRNEELNKPTVAFCGSMIQQNYGENVEGHGFLLWDLSDLSYEEFDINNDYSYHTIHVIDSKMYNENVTSSNPRIRLKVKNTPQSTLKTIKNDLKTKYNIKHLKVVEDRDDMFNSELSEEINEQYKRIINGSLRDIDFQTEVIVDYIKEHNLEVDEDVLEAIKELNIEVNAEIKDKYKHIARNVVWYPKKFTFDNMFSYGEDNIVDFSDMEGLYGLFAPNRSGKSALFDALSFTCYDRSSRTSKANHVLNNTKDSFKSSFIFNHNGTDYEIVRDGYKKKLYGKYKNEDHVKVDCKFFKYDEESGEKIDISGESRLETMEIIQKYLGTYDDFILTTISLQGNNEASFIDKTQKERKELLLQFLDFNIFEQLYNISSSLVKDKQAVLRELKKTDRSDEYGECKTNIESISKEIEDLNEQREEMLNMMSIYDGTINDLHRKLKTVKSPKLTEDKIKEQFSDNEDEINNITSNLNESHKTFVELEIQLKTLMSDLGDLKNKVDVTSLKELKQQRNDLLKELAQYKQDMTKFTSELDVHKNTIEDLSKYKFKPNCDFCKDNPISQDREKIKNLIKSLEGEIKEWSIKISSIQEKLSEYDGIDDKLEKYHELQQEINSNEHRISTIKHERELITLNMKELVKENEDLNKMLHEWDTCKDDVEQNKKILTEIEENQNILNGIYKKKDDIDSKITSKSVEREMNIQTVKNIDQQISKMTEIENEIDSYELYKVAVSRDGVPFDIISNILPKIEVEVNSILSHIVDFQISLKLDGKNIDCYIMYDDENFWPIELGSGMEKFISSLAIRTALINVSCLPRPNFLCCDEGFGTLDKENMSQLFNLFTFLKTQFDFLIVISHLEVMRDIVDNLIEITKDEDTTLSNINHQM